MIYVTPIFLTIVKSVLALNCDFFYGKHFHEKLHFKKLEHKNNSMNVYLLLDDDDKMRVNVLKCKYM